MPVTRRPHLLASFLLPFFLLVPLHPQGTDAPPQQTSGYPVTGRMVCGDTQKAARFAQVTLIPATTGNGGGRRLAARTDLDGNFLVPNAPIGDYYVTGSLPGYVNQSALIQNTLNNGSDTSALAGIPLVHVTAGGASTLLSLSRGGILAGSVTWDDGTPAAGVNVSAQPATTSNSTGAAQLNQGFRGGPGNAFFGTGAGAQTDDRGRFRLAGLAPGSYYLRANIQAPAPQRPGDTAFARTLSLSVYAPNKVRRSDATPITLTSGEERADLAVTIGLAAMHTVSGAVSSSAAPVRSGNATLTDQTDSSLSRNVRLSSDGSFTIPYVPAGTYTLQVTASSQPLTDGRGERVDASDTTRFQPTQESVTVTDTDLSGLAITVTQATASQ